MKLIENKKLFGKINIVDIVLVLIILVVGLIGYKKIFTNDSGVSIGAKYYKTNFLLKIESVPASIFNYLEEGVDVYDNETNTYIGKLTSFYSGDAMVKKVDLVSNKYVLTKRPEKINIYLNVEVEVADNPGDLINSNNYYVKIGKYINIRSGKFAAGGYIIGVDRIEEIETKLPEFTDDSFSYKFFIADIADTSAKGFKVGDEIFDKMSSASLGYITDIDAKPSRQIVDVLDGSVVLSEVPERIDVTLTITTNGQQKNGEYLANNLTRLQAGSFKQIKTDYIMCSGMVVDIEK